MASNGLGRVAGQAVNQFGSIAAKQLGGLSTVFGGVGKNVGEAVREVTKMSGELSAPFVGQLRGSRLPGAQREAEYMKWASERWITFSKYASVELKPPFPHEVPAAYSGACRFVGTLKNWRQLTTKESLAGALIAAEIGVWFYIGEIVGRRSLVGYRAGRSTRNEKYLALHP